MVVEWVRAEGMDGPGAPVLPHCFGCLHGKAPSESERASERARRVSVCV